MEQPEITNPTLWRLLVLIEGSSIRALALSTVDDVQTVAFTVPFDPTSSGLLQAVEEAVYAVPLLTADFASVDVLVDTSDYIVVPSSLGREAALEAAAYCCIADEGEELHTDDIPALQATVVWPCLTELANFLARTFRNPRVACRISPLLRFFGVKNAGGNAAKLYAHLGGGVNPTVDMMAFGRDGSLLMCSTKPAPSVADAAYWIMAGAREAGIDTAADSIYLCGDTSARLALAPELGRLAANVLPFIFPSAAFRGGHDVLKAPFPLILIPLCE